MAMVRRYLGIDKNKLFDITFFMQQPNGTSNFEKTNKCEKLHLSSVFFFSSSSSSYGVGMICSFRSGHIRKFLYDANRSVRSMR